METKFKPWETAYYISNYKVESFKIHNMTLDEHEDIIYRDWADVFAKELEEFELYKTKKEVIAEIISDIDKKITQLNIIKENIAWN